MYPYSLPVKVRKSVVKSLRQLDEIVIDVLIDNQSDSYSSKPAFVSPEFNNVIAAGSSEISGTTLCCAQLGLSIMLTAQSGGKRHKMLFDAGPEGDIFIRNSKNLGVTLDDVEAIGVSHGHWDHMGALVPALGQITRNGQRQVPCHVNPDMFYERAARLSNGRTVPFQLVPSISELEEHGALVVNEADERFLLDEYFYLSGEIPRISSFEKGRKDHFARASHDAEWKPDPLLMDERFLAVLIADKGLLLFSSCSHAGVINVLECAKARFPELPIFGVFGGLHLVGSLEQIIPQTVEAFRTFELKQIVPAHCTGWRAVHALLKEFGEEIVVPSAVGSKYTYRSS
ncbi:MAG TPA: MBL fold metallo-hydrolase [Drouetiella sp.]|jgi:7,8-dihydropterin-6-yl-methyl-4-(beta-D-ribofuranosyl)aminobenzene 5'-phosphate synthase